MTESRTGLGYFITPEQMHVLLCLCNKINSEATADATAAGKLQEEMKVLLNKIRGQ